MKLSVRWWRANPPVVYSPAALTSELSKVSVLMHQPSIGLLRCVWSGPVVRDADISDQTQGELKAVWFFFVRDKTEWTTQCWLKNCQNKSCVSVQPDINHMSIWIKTAGFWISHKTTASVSNRILATSFKRKQYAYRNVHVHWKFRSSTFAKMCAVYNNAHCMRYGILQCSALISCSI